MYVDDLFAVSQMDHAILNFGHMQENLSSSHVTCSESPSATRLPFTMASGTSPRAIEVTRNISGVIGTEACSATGGGVGATINSRQV
jgi:hypothetical protein